MNEEKRDENVSSCEIEKGSPKLEKKDLMLSLAVILLCGCILSGAIPSAFVGFASAILFAYTVVAVRNIGAVMQLLITSIIATVLTFLPIAGAAVLALMLGTGTLAWLFMTLPKHKWAPTCILIFSYGMGFLITSNPIVPLLAFAFVPAAALMAWARARDLGRTSTVLHALLGFILVICESRSVLLFLGIASAFTLSVSALLSICINLLFVIAPA